MSARHKTAWGLAALCALPGFAWAVSESEPLPMVFETAPEPAERPNGVPVVSLRIARNCALYLPAVEDARSNKASVGHLTVMQPSVHATPRSVQSLRSGDATAWTRGALQSMSRYGFQPVLGVAPAGSDAGAGTSGSRQVTADVALRLAHAWSSNLNLVSHVVLQVRYRMPGGQTEARSYHGMGTRTNFASGNGEFMTVLNLGLEEAVHALALDAAALCDGKPLPTPVAVP